MARILVVEDERIVAKDIEATLTQLGYQVAATVGTGEEAVAAADRLRPDLVIMDIHLGAGMDGVEAAAQINLRNAIPVVFLTAYTDTETLERAKITEPYGYIVKPFEDREIHTAIEIGLYRHRIQAELTRLNAWLTTLLGSMGDGVIGLDAAGRIEYVNPRAADMLGVPADAIQGQGWQQALAGHTPRDRARLQRAIELAATQNSSTPIPQGTRLKTPDGHSLPTRGTVSPILSPSGSTTGTVVVLHDLRLDEKVDSLKVEVKHLRKRLEERAQQLI